MPIAKGRQDTAIPPEELRKFLEDRPFTAPHSAIHEELAERLVGAGVRRVGDVLIMPCGTPPGFWLESQKDILQLIAHEERIARTRRNRPGGEGDGAAAEVTPPPSGLSPMAAARVRKERDAAVTEKLAEANTETFKKGRRRAS